MIRVFMSVSDIWDTPVLNKDRYGVLADPPYDYIYKVDWQKWHDLRDRFTREYRIVELSDEEFAELALTT